MPKLNNRSFSIPGFTLIEIMVAISVMTAISSITLAGLNTARYKTFDAKFMSEMTSLRNALFMYKSSTGKYPECPFGVVCTDFAGHWGLDSALNSLVTNGYISKIPHYQNWPQAVNTRNVYLIYSPNTGPSINPGYTYSTETVCRQLDVASWSPGMFPNGAVIIYSDGPLNFPKVLTTCSDNMGNNVCTTNTNYYCMELP